MATVTICDICGCKPDIRKINNWFELKTGNGFLAKFINKVRYELCGKCYSEMMKYLKEKEAN